MNVINYYKNFLKEYFKKSTVIFIPVYLIFAFLTLLIITIVLPFEKLEAEILLSQSGIMKAIVFAYTPGLILSLFAFPLSLFFLSRYIFLKKKSSDIEQSIQLKTILFLLLLVVINIVKIIFYIPLLPGIVLSVFLLYFPVFFTQTGRGFFQPLKLSIGFAKKHFLSLLLIVLLVFIIHSLYYFLTQKVIKPIVPLYSHTFFDNLPLFKQNIYFYIPLIALAESIFSALEGLFYLSYYQRYSTLKGSDK